MKTKQMILVDVTDYAGSTKHVDGVVCDGIREAAELVVGAVPERHRKQIGIRLGELIEERDETKNKWKVTTISGCVNGDLIGERTYVFLRKVRTVIP